MKPESPTAPPPLHEPPRRRKTTFKGDVLRLVTGTGLAQIISVLAAPILTRLYAPEAFGAAALFVSLTGILGVLACMRYELSIVLPDNDREAANLLGVSLCFSVLIALLTVPIIGYGGPQVLQRVRMPELVPYLWLVPITVLIHGVFTALNYWNTRTKHFARQSIARVTSAVATTSATLGAGFAGHATGGAMIAASVGGQAVATTVLGGQIWRDNGRFLVQSITWWEMWAGVKRYKKFPLLDSWSGLLNTISVQLPVLILGGFFSPAIVGFYALGHRLLNLPMGLLGTAIGQVFFQRAAVAKKERSLPQVVLSTFERLMLIAAYPFMVLMVIGPELFAFVFGPAWATAGTFVQILAPWLFFVFLGSPISTLISILELQEIGLQFNIVLTITRIASLVTGGLLGDFILALGLFALSGTLLWGWFCVYLTLKSGIETREIRSVFLPQILLGVSFVIPTMVCTLILDFQTIWILTVTVFAACGYYLASALRNPQLRTMVLSLIPQTKKSSP